MALALVAAVAVLVVAAATLTSSDHRPAELEATGVTTSSTGSTPTSEPTTSTTSSEPDPTTPIEAAASTTTKTTRRTPSASKATGPTTTTAATTTTTTAAPTSGSRPTRTPTGDYTFSCVPSTLTITASKSATVMCTATSVGGFSGTIQVRCQNPPFPCSFDRQTVDVPKDGSGTAAAVIQVPGSWGAGGADQWLFSNFGTVTHNPSVHVDVATFKLRCSTPSARIYAGQTTELVSCEATSLNAWSGAADFSCGHLAPGMSCAFSPTSATVPANGKATTVFRVHADPDVPSGRYALSIVGTSDGIVSTTSFDVDVDPPPG